MKDINDQELQDMIEQQMKSGMPVADDQDVKAYSMLFNALAKQPDISLPYSFSSKVMTGLIAKKSRSSEIRLYVIIGLALLILSVATFFYLGTISVGPSYQLITVLSKYKLIAVFGITTVFIIQYLDQKLVRKTL